MEKAFAFSIALYTGFLVAYWGKKSLGAGQCFELEEEHE
jgi:hypothetical protein